MGKAQSQPHILIILVTTIAFFLCIPQCLCAGKKETKQAEKYRMKGYRAQQLGNLQAALSYYQRAMQADPYYAVVYNDLGVVYEATGKRQAAKEAYFRAIALNPKLLSAYSNLASLFEQEGDRKNAAYYWKMRMDLGDWDDEWTWKAKQHLDDITGVSHERPGTPPPSAGLSQDYQANPEREAKYHVMRGREFYNSGEYLAALKEFMRAVMLDPNNREAEQLAEMAEHRVLLYH